MATTRIEVLPRQTTFDVRDELHRSQRGRLICAVADVVAVDGYAAASVEGIIVQAGVSRKTFYQHFENKQACFLAAYDTGSQAIHAAMLASSRDASDWEQILDSVLGTWLAFLQSDLAFTRAYMIEFWGAGEEARKRWKHRRDRTAGLLSALHQLIREQDPTVVPASDTLIAAVVGGINRVMISHVLDHDRRPLTDLKPDLVDFTRRVLAVRDYRG